MASWLERYAPQKEYQLTWIAPCRWCRAARTIARCATADDHLAYLLSSYRACRLSPMSSFVQLARPASSQERTRTLIAHTLSANDARLAPKPHEGKVANATRDPVCRAKCVVLPHRPKLSFGPSMSVRSIENGSEQGDSPTGIDATSENRPFPSNDSDW